MGATTQLKTAIVRVGPEHESYGDPYDFVVHVTIVGDIGLCEGGVGSVTPGTPQRVLEALQPYGVRALQWERRKKGRVRDVVMAAD